MNKLFVYGIFLDEHNRQSYGMANPQYATVRDYATYGHGIVTAHKQTGAGLSLSGLLVDVAPYSRGKHGLIDTWAELDALEYGYDRVIVKTTDGDKAYMYAAKEIDDLGKQGK